MTHNQETTNVKSKRTLESAKHALSFATRTSKDEFGDGYEYDCDGKGLWFKFFVGWTITWKAENDRAEPLAVGYFCVGEDRKPGTGIVSFRETFHYRKQYFHGTEALALFDCGKPPQR